MSKILIIEDEEAIADLEKDYLELSGFEVEIANRGDVGLEKALNEDYDLIILDLMLPEVDGFDICRQVRQEKNIPIIMVSAKKDDIDKIRGLGLGADDYMTKPYSLKELAARVYAQVRRSVMQGFIIDHHQQSLTAGNHVIPLSQKEFDLFLYLLGNPGRILTPDELYREVWRTGKPDTTNSVAVHIARLRRKLDEVGHLVGSIETVRGEGYEFQPRSEARTRL